MEYDWDNGIYGPCDLNLLVVGFEHCPRKFRSWLVCENDDPRQISPTEKPLCRKGGKVLMDRGVLRRLVTPVLILLVFGILGIFNYDTLARFRSDAIDQTQKVLAYIIQIGIWLSAAHLISRIFAVVVWDALVVRTIGEHVPRLIRDLFTVLIYLIAVTGIVALVFNQSVSGFWATSGLVGLVVGLALKNVILDVFTGLAINVDRQYRIGDWIMVHSDGGQITGRIEEVNWRTTRLYTEDDSVVVVPNSMLGERVVTNLWGGGPESRFDGEIILDFSVPTDRALRILTAGALSAVGRGGVLEKPEPNVIIAGTNEFGVEYRIRFWTGPWHDGITAGTARSAIMGSVLSHLRVTGITPAYPKQDVYHSRMPTRHQDVESLGYLTKLLRQTEIFRQLEDEELLTLATQMHRRVVSAGMHVICQGEAGDSMFILSEGLLHAFIHSEDGGAYVKVGQIEPGEFFGEMSLLTGERRSATILAVTDVVVQEITQAHMAELLGKRREIGEILSRVVAERRINNTASLAAAPEEKRNRETASLANQIMDRIRSFFRGVFEDT